ncbi:alpha/beta hydrolase [Actinomadura hibisca]|uniref:alpha/beta hydrolase n=1 Tax=Actinomadura hibisca TaxID=68565 RepID=UPI001FDEC11D|nr:alpha/beta hydrolase [Actinomadura hibisca]
MPSDSGSWRSRTAARLAVRTVRPLASALPLNGPGIWLSRRIVAASLARFGPALPGCRVEVTGDGEWVRGPGARDDAVLLYLHGSAYLLCSARTHRGLTSRLAAWTGLPVFAPDYRLAPEHRFPAAADDVRAAYDRLAADGRRVVVAGDSAGGHLAVDLALQLCREGRPAPEALVLFSPLVDLSLEAAAGRDVRRRDPMISAGKARRLVHCYVRDADPASPRLAFGLCDGDALPPTLVQAGGAEMLAADAEHLAALFDGCELEIWPDQMHVFQALPRLIPEADPALRRAAAFIDARLTARQEAA